MHTFITNLEALILILVLYSFLVRIIFYDGLKKFHIGFMRRFMVIAVGLIALIGAWQGGGLAWALIHAACYIAALEINDQINKRWTPSR